MRRFASLACVLIVPRSLFIQTNCTHTLATDNVGICMETDQENSEETIKPQMENANVQSHEKNVVLTSSECYVRGMSNMVLSLAVLSVEL